jgi:hypothetical protein
VNHRIRVSVVILVCGLLATVSVSGQSRDPVSAGVRRAVLLATNSIQVDADAVVVSGDLVVNDEPTSPLLGEASLAIDRGVVTPAGANVIADSIDIDRGATVGGDAYYNRLQNDGTLLGTRFSPLSLPVFSTLPQVLFSSGGTQFLSVPAGQTVDVAEGEYSILNVGVGGVARLTGQAYAFLSINILEGGSVVCTGPCSITVAMRVHSDANTTFGGPDATRTVLHVAGDVEFGRGSNIDANVYAPNGTLLLDRGSDATGSFYARDIHVGRNSRLTLASAFDAAPTADAQSVFTNGATPLTIVLTGSDPEGQPLQFATTSVPAFGTLGPVTQLTPSSASVTYTPNGAGNLEDSFTFTVTDPGGAIGSAIVRINPPREEPPPPPPTTVVADDLSADVIQNTTENLLLVAAAPDGVSLTFSIVSGPTHGTLGPIAVFEGQTTVPYSPDTDYTGPDSFQFQACGQIGPDTVCDTALFSIDVLPFRAELPDLASNIETSTFADQSVVISLGPTSVQSLRTTAIRANAAFIDSVEVAGTVSDANGDGVGDGHMALPASTPVFMSAGVGMSGAPGSNGTVRMQFEWDISTFGTGDLLQSATMHLNTHRGTIDSLPTRFFFITSSPGDGALTDGDFQGSGERVRGGVMEVPVNMAIGEEGTFEMSVLGELKNALSLGLPFLTIQGRVDETLQGPARGLEVRTSCEINRDSGLEPTLFVTTPGVTAPLIYSIQSLPLAGTLFDGQTPILEVPYELSTANVTYQPPAGFIGQTSFGYGVQGATFDEALVIINVRLRDCATDPAGCDDGR